MSESKNKRRIGNEYEEKAADFLKQQGYQILEKNYFGRSGEIDLIAKEDCYYVFIEVKYRAKSKYGLPEEAIDYRKIQHITKTAMEYMREHHMSELVPCRFDVVVILEEEIKLIQNAFDAMM